MITFCIGDETGKRFRDVARRRIGDRKGCPGKATTEALELWIRMQPREEIAKNALAQAIRANLRKQVCSSRFID
jgi:hypothetical protein